MFDKKVVQNLANLMKDIDLYIQEAQQTKSEMRSTLRHIINSL